MSTCATATETATGSALTPRALASLNALGVTPALWRTPWGITASFTEEVAREHELRIVGWSVDTHDWRGDTACEMLSATRPGLQAGAVVVAHDGIGPGARRTDAAETVTYTELVADHARRSALSLEALA